MLVFASEAALASAVLESIAQILVKAVSAELVQLSVAASYPFPCVAFWVPVHRPQASVVVVNKVGELEELCHGPLAELSSSVAAEVDVLFPKAYLVDAHGSEEPILGLLLHVGPALGDDVYVLSPKPIHHLAKCPHCIADFIPMPILFTSLF